MPHIPVRALLHQSARIALVERHAQPALARRLDRQPEHIDAADHHHEADELRRELARIGYVVRDEKTNQYWRAVGTRR